VSKPDPCSRQNGVGIPRAGIRGSGKPKDRVRQARLNWPSTWSNRGQQQVDGLNAQTAVTVVRHAHWLYPFVDMQRIEPEARERSVRSTVVDNHHYYLEVAMAQSASLIFELRSSLIEACVTILSGLMDRAYTAWAQGNCQSLVFRRIIDIGGLSVDGAVPVREQRRDERCRRLHAR